MKLYRKHIDKLVGIVNSSQNPNTHFLTCYYDSQNRFKGDDLKRLKSQLLTGIKRHGIPDPADILYQDFIQTVIGKVNENQSLNAGLALFARIYSNTFTIDDLIYLHHPPQKAVFINDVYDLEQLLWMNEITIPSLIINISRHHADFYEKTGHLINHLATLKNPYQVLPDKHYLEQYNPSGQDQNIHGSGDKNLQRRIQDQNQLFLDDVRKLVKTWKANGKSYDIHVYFYSSEFTDHIDSFIHQTAKESGSPVTLSQNVQVQDWQELSQIAQNLIEDHIEQVKVGEFNAAKENFHAFLDEWEDIYDAAEENRINTLFIPTPPQEQPEVIAHLVHQVAGSGGRVYLMKNTHTPVSASIRY